MALQGGLSFEHVHGGHAGAAPVQAGDEGVGLDQLGPGGVDQQGRGLHARQVFQGHDAPGVVRQPQLQGDDVALLEELGPAGRGLVSVAERPCAGSLAAPDADIHTKSATVTSQDLPDLAVAPDAERFAPQHVAEAKIGRHRG